MTDDPTLKAAREARLARMSESYIGEVIFPSEALVRRYDAIRFKELHERVAELEEALKESEKVRGMLAEALKYWRPESLPPMFDGFDPVIAGHRQKWADATAALAVTQALDGKEG